MTSGGARVRSGPPPDPNALRRDRDASEWTRLPARRDGELPAFPLARPRKRELAIWETEWTRPQAVMWEAYARFHEVAIYIRSLVDAERVGASVSARNLLLRQQDSLGLTLAGLRANRWIIAADDAPITVDAPRRGVRRGSMEKARMSGLGIIDGGA